MDAAYVILKNDGVWLVDGQGDAHGPYVEVATVLDALGPPTPQTEALAELAYALLVP